MEKGINLATLEFKENIVMAINSSGLPPCIVQLVLNETIKTVSELNEKAVQSEREALEKKEGVEDGEEICKG